MSKLQFTGSSRVLMRAVNNFVSPQSFIFSLAYLIKKGKLSGLMQQVKLGIIGGGTVGGGVFKALQTNGALLSSRLGIKIEVVRVAAKALEEPQRKVDIPHSLITLDWKSLVNDPQVQIVAELAGGITVAREMILTALRL